MHTTTNHYTLNPLCQWRRTARNRLIIPVRKIALHKNRIFQLKATSQYEKKIQTVEILSTLIKR